jgi:hypothetical protein
VQGPKSNYNQQRRGSNCEAGISGVDFASLRIRNSVHLREKNEEANCFQTNGHQIGFVLLAPNNETILGRRGGGSNPSPDHPPASCLSLPLFCSLTCIMWPVPNGVSFFFARAVSNGGEAVLNQVPEASIHPSKHRSERERSTKKFYPGERARPRAKFSGECVAPH